MKLVYLFLYNSIFVSSICTYLIISKHLVDIRRDNDNEAFVSSGEQESIEEAQQRVGGRLRELRRLCDGIAKH